MLRKVFARCTSLIVHRGSVGTTRRRVPPEHRGKRGLIVTVIGVGLLGAVTLSPSAQGGGGPHGGGNWGGGHSGNGFMGSGRTGSSFPGGNRMGTGSVGGTRTGSGSTGGGRTGSGSTGGGRTGISQTKSGHPGSGRSGGAQTGNGSYKGPNHNSNYNRQHAHSPAFIHGHVHHGKAMRHWVYRWGWNGWSKSCWHRKWGCPIFWSPGDGCWYYYSAEDTYVPCDDLTDEDFTDS